MDETVVLPPGAVLPPNPVPVVIKTQGLGVRRGNGWALRELTLSLPIGCVVAISGPIGSGHTRSLLALSGRHRLDEGTVQVADGSAVIGWFSDLAMLDDEMTVTQTMAECVLSMGADVELIDSALAWATIQERKDSPISALTSEERVLLGLAWCSLSDKQVIAVEATCVVTIGSPVWTATRSLAAHGKTVLIGTALPHPPAEIVIPIPWELAS